MNNFMYKSWAKRLSDTIEPLPEPRSRFYPDGERALATGEIDWRRGNWWICGLDENYVFDVKHRTMLDVPVSSIVLQSPINNRFVDKEGWAKMDNLVFYEPPPDRTVASFVIAADKPNEEHSVLVAYVGRESAMGLPVYTSPFSGLPPGDIELRWDGYKVFKQPPKEMGLVTGLLLLGAVKLLEKFIKKKGGQ